MFIGEVLFKTEPENQSAIEGEIVQFHCSVSSDSPLAFTWEFTRKGFDHSQVIAHLTGPVVPHKYSVVNLGHATSRLEVFSTEISDAGRYTCRVSIGYGQSIHANAQLELLCK